MRKYLFALALISTPAMAQVPPEIARDCAAKWGSDYDMQVYCRNKQMKALRTLQDQDRPAPQAIPSVRFQLCRVAGLESIMFTTKSNFPAGDGTELLYGKKTFSVAIGSGFWSTDNFIFSFKKRSPGKDRYDVEVQNQRGPKQTWKGFCFDLKQ